MKKFIPAIAMMVTAIVTLPDANAQKLNSYQSKWNPGLQKETEEALINQMQLDEKSQFLFMVSNDDKNLFIDLVVADRAAVQKIMRYGLTTWFNPDAKHKKVTGIEFPVTSEGQAQPDFARNKNNGDKKEMRMAMMAAKNQEMTLIGFDVKGERKVINPKNDPDFNGNLEMLEGGRVKVSLVISLAKLQRAEPSSFSAPFSLGFETGYMDVTGTGMSSGGGQQGGGAPGAGGGGMYGGGMPGGGPPSGSGAPGSMSGNTQQQERPDISQLASPTRLWIKQVTLSKQQ
jgi:hypothetical protein